MTTDFTILSGITVPSDYSWDKGLPFTPGLSTVITPIAVSAEDIPGSETIYISGYSPGFKVYFKNNSTNDIDYQFIEYNWNFGDFYNDSNNSISLSCPVDVEHIYIMPGLYTVALNQTQSKEQTNTFVGPQQCLGKYNYQWYWDNLVCGLAEEVTWDETACDGTLPKWWDNETQCFQKHCKFWSWYDLQSIREAANPVTWEQTKSTGSQAIFSKKWAFEANDTVCSSNTDTTFFNTICSQSQTTIKTAIIEVFEILPMAKLYSVTRPSSGVSPFSVQITPRTTVPGSFPIDRIDWDPGDGTPIKTVTRYSAPDSTYFTYTNTFSTDIQDPRNYDLLYTYKRNINNYSMFYPSISVYSSSTASQDSCSLTIGPIALSGISSSVNLLKVRNTPSGKLYSLQADNNITFVTSQTANTTMEFVPNQPKNIIRDSFGTPVLYTGNIGSNYPPTYIPSCVPAATTLFTNCTAVTSVIDGQIFSITDGCYTEINYSTTLTSCATSTGITIVNNVPSNIQVKVAGVIDDEFVVNGSVYEPGMYPFAWNNAGNPCGSTTGDNGAHSFTYYDTLIPGEAILLQVKDNGFGGGGSFVVTLSV